jgi:phosphocarrier protein HPr
MPASSEPRPQPSADEASPSPWSGGPAPEPPATGAVERVVVLPKHLHARPAGQLAQAAARHQPTTIELVAGERRVNARSVLAIMGLGAVRGTRVRVIATGPDAATVADEVVGILEFPEAAG